MPALQKRIAQGAFAAAFSPNASAIDASITPLLWITGTPLWKSLCACPKKNPLNVGEFPAKGRLY